jgi:hypothetical protein
MLSRRAILWGSIVVSLVAHGLLVAYSDRLALFDVDSARTRAWQTFRVDLKQYTPPPAPVVEPSAGGGKAGEAAARAASLEELLARETELLKPAEDAQAADAEVPQLAERVAKESIEREHNLAPDEETLNRIDSKVIEIAQNEARQDIEVPRKLARPSAPRVLAENELPTFGGDGAVQDETLALPATGPSAFSSEPVEGQPPVAEASAMQAAAAPDRPEEKLILPMERDAPEVPAEQLAARAPLSQELRAQNPYEFFDDLVDIQVESYVPKDEQEGYFRLRISPKKGGNVQVLPKDVTFVVDASNSIVQRKLDASVEGLKKALDLLRPDDLFNVVVFRDSPKYFQADRVPATKENKAAAIAFINGLKSFGQTDIFSAIRPVVNVPARDGIPGMVLVVTDGRPTAGLRDGRMIINSLTEENSKRNPIYAFSGGQTVNRYLLDLLAYRNKGESYVSGQIEAMGKDLPTFFRQLNDPILMDLRADYGNVDDANLFPRELPDFFRGRAVTVYGRFDPKKDGEMTMRLVGKAATKQKELVFKTDLKQARGGDEEIARAWAFRKVYYLIGEIVRAGETPERTSELRELCRRYNIKTVYDE